MVSERHRSISFVGKSEELCASWYFFNGWRHHCGKIFTQIVLLRYNYKRYDINTLLIREIQKSEIIFSSYYFSNSKIKYKLIFLICLIKVAYVIKLCYYVHLLSYYLLSLVKKCWSNRISYRIRPRRLCANVLKCAITHLPYIILYEHSFFRFFFALLFYFAKVYVY